MPANREAAKLAEYKKQLGSLSDKALTEERERVEEQLYWSRHEGGGPERAQRRTELEQQWNAVREVQEAKEGRPWTYRHDRRDNYEFVEQEVPRRDGKGTERHIVARGELANPDTTIRWRSDTLYGAKLSEESQTSVSKGTGDDAGHLIGDQFGVDPSGVNAGEARRKGMEPKERLNYGLQNRPMNRYAAYQPVEQAVAARLRMQGDGDETLFIAVRSRSRGGGEGQLAALWLARDGYRVDGVCSFEAPHVSDDPALAVQYRNRGIENMTRVERSGDLITVLNSATPADPYANALGGRPPGEGPRTRPRLGDFLYIDADLRVRRNPTGEEVRQDSLETFRRSHVAPVGMTLQAHVRYDQALFLDMDERDKKDLRKKLVDRRETTESRLLNARPGTRTWGKHDALEVEYNAVCREQEALKGRDWTSKRDRRFAYEFHDSETPTVRGPLPSPAETINWLDVHHIKAGHAEAMAAFQSERAKGKVCLIGPEFGMDPHELRNYQHVAAREDSSVGPGGSRGSASTVEEPRTSSGGQHSRAPRVEAPGI